MIRPFILSTVFAATAFSALADTTETYDFSGFNELDIAAGVEVKYETASTYSVVADFSRGGPDDKLNEVEASSGSSIQARGINADDFTLRVSSGASAELSGSCKELDLKVSSGGDADAKDLQCLSLSASASSGGSASAYAIESATGKTSSGGSIDVWGDPPSRTSNHSISGGSTDFH